MTREELNMMSEALRKGIKLNGIEVADKPIAEKVGFIIVPELLDANHLAWKYEPDPNYVPEADGTYLNPFEYTDGMEVVAGMWYAKDGDVWEAIKDGAPSEWADTEYFEVIG